MLSFAIGIMGACSCCSMFCAFCINRRLSVPGKKVGKDVKEGKENVGEHQVSPMP